jgi:hypothetical protein
MADSTKKPPKKNSFQIPKLSETEWGIAGAVVFVFGYMIYTTLFPAGSTATTGYTAPPPPSQQQTESAEERFKRENQNTQLPSGDALAPEFIQNETRITQEIPTGDRELAFQIRLPNDWRMSEFGNYGTIPGQETYAVLTNIARYFGPAIVDARPYLRVEVERMKRYLPADLWAHVYMTKRGIAPQAVQKDNEKDMQALYVEMNEDMRSFAVRSRFIIHGDTMMVISFGVPISSYKDFKDLMGLTLNSVNLPTPIDRPIEEIKEEKLLNVLSFNYYGASWIPRNHFLESTLRPSLELHNPQEGYNPKNDKLQGLVLVNAWRKTGQFSPERAMKSIEERLAVMHTTLKKPPESKKDLPLFGNFTFAKQYEYLGQINAYTQRDKYDIIQSEESKAWRSIVITVLDNGYYQVYLTLVTPSREVDYIPWAQNMLGYELLLKSIQVRGAPTDE